MENTGMMTDLFVYFGFHGTPTRYTSYGSKTENIILANYWLTKLHSNTSGQYHLTCLR
jgi:hypothetical protein